MKPARVDELVGMFSARKEPRILARAAETIASASRRDKVPCMMTLEVKSTMKRT